MKKLVFAVSMLTATYAFAAIASGAASADSTITKNSDESARQTFHLTVTDVTEQYQNSSKYITLDSLTKKNQIASKAGITNFSLQGAAIAATLQEADVIVDKVINIGTKIWTVVAKGQAVTSYNGVKASAMPENIKSWTELEGWKDPQVKVFKVVYGNRFFDVLTFVYRVVLVAGGSYNGVGNYIGYVSVDPVQISAWPLVTFNARAEVGMVYNKGSSANPIGGMVLTVSWDLSPSAQKGSHVLYLDGLGNIKMPQPTSSAPLLN